MAEQARLRLKNVGRAAFFCPEQLVATPGTNYRPTSGKRPCGILPQKGFSSRNWDE
jgi:hypothetical protein